MSGIAAGTWNAAASGTDFISYDKRRFRQHPGSVLLAVGAAWEGMDFLGDGVSLLVIPRLPFPYPNAVKENERERYSSLQEFIQSVALPEMQIKLRQGFGRAIRTETDTCVIAILDERAARGGRYLTERASGKILWEDSGKVAFREINRNILCCYMVILGGK